MVLHCYQSSKVAHRLTTIKASDVIYVLKDGYCCEQGNHEELMEKKGQYYSMAKLQQAKREEEDQDEETQKSRLEERHATAHTSLVSACSEAQQDHGMSVNDPGNDTGKAVPPRLWCRLMDMMNIYWWVSCWFLVGSHIYHRYYIGILFPPIPYLRTSKVWPVAVIVVLAGAAAMPLEAVFFNAAVVGLSETAKDFDLEAMGGVLGFSGLGFRVVGFRVLGFQGVRV